MRAQALQQMAVSDAPVGNAIPPESPLTEEEDLGGSVKSNPHCIYDVEAILDFKHDEQVGVLGVSITFYLIIGLRILLFGKSSGLGMKRQLGSLRNIYCMCDALSFLTNRQ